MKKLLLIAALGAASYFALDPALDQSSPRAARDASVALAPRDEQALEHAFVNRLSDQQVAGEGTVVKLLADDDHGSRHQRFILRLASGRTLLISHNIDLAPRIDSLRVGDAVAFYGEYEWNAKGGVVHWTHHDPRGQHAAGWLKHAGRIYQ
jgi:hypothetical protein